MIFQLMEGFQKHHKVYIPKNYKSKNGIEAMRDVDNVITHIFVLSFIAK
jgi:hypothetical protein